MITGNKRGLLWDGRGWENGGEAGIIIGGENGKRTGINLGCKGQGELETSGNSMGRKGC